MSIGTCKFWHTVVLFFCMCKVKNHRTLTRGSQEPVIAHLVFNLTSKVDRKWGLTHNFESGPPKDHFNSNF
jgi:hypothetical protein